MLLDGGSLTCADIAAAARDRAPITLAPTVRDRVAASHRMAEEVSATRAVYGRSTGVGANRSVPVADPAAHALALLRSHATSAGPARAPERVRALLVVRLNQLAAGGSGISPAVLDALAAMITGNDLPVVREHGSIGTGDLPALATVALALRDRSGELSFGPHDALPFLSSNAAAIGDAALACTDLTVLARAAVVVAALTFAAVEGNSEAYAAAVERVTPFPGARQVCRWMRDLTAGATPPRRIQDSFGLRALPQVHGMSLDALAALDGVISGLANAPAENPVVLPTSAGGFAHHGGFHAAYLGLALDAAAIAVAQAAQLVQARVATLADPAMTGLPAFLGDGTPGASGVMLLEYVAASCLADLRSAATPAGLQSAVLSVGLEEDASFASLGARQALGSVGSLRTLLACELVAAVRALRMRPEPPAGRVAEALAVCDALPSATADRDLTTDLEVAEQLLDALADLLGPAVAELPTA